MIDHYTHVVEGQRRAAMDKLGAAPAMENADERGQKVARSNPDFPTATTDNVAQLTVNADR
jgi:hypothetical protein